MSKFKSLEFLGWGYTETGILYFGFMFMGILFYIDENGKEVIYE